MALSKAFKVPTKKNFNMMPEMPSNRFSVMPNPVYDVDPSMEVPPYASGRNIVPESQLQERYLRDTAGSLATPPMREESFVDRLPVESAYHRWTPPNLVGSDYYYMDPPDPEEQAAYLRGDKPPPQVFEEATVPTARPEDIVESPAIPMKRQGDKTILNMPPTKVTGNYIGKPLFKDFELFPEMKEPAPAPTPTPQEEYKFEPNTRILPEQSLPEFRQFLRNLQTTGDEVSRSGEGYDALFKLMSRTAASTGVYRGEQPKPILPQFIDDYRGQEQQDIENRLARQKLIAQAESQDALAAQREFKAERDRAMLPYDQLLKQAQAGFYSSQDQQKLFSIITEKELQDPLSQRSLGVKAGLDAQVKLKALELQGMGRDASELLINWNTAKQHMSGADALRFAFANGVDIDPMVKNYAQESDNTIAAQQLNSREAMQQERLAHERALQAQKASQETRKSQITNTGKKVIATEAGVDFTAQDIQRELASARNDAALATGSEVQNTTEQIENELGFKLSDIQPDGSVIINGVRRSADNVLPGYNLAFMTNPVNKVNKKHIALMTKINRIMNQQLKERSGAAVTAQEYARFRSEWASNHWNTKKDFLVGLKGFVDFNDRFLEDNLSEYNPKTIQILSKERGRLYFRNSYNVKNPKLQPVIQTGSSIPAATVTAPKKGRKFRDKIKGGPVRMVNDEAVIKKLLERPDLYEEVK